MICKAFETNHIECACDEKFTECGDDIIKVFCKKRDGFKYFSRLLNRFLTSSEISEIQNTQGEA